MVILTNGVRDWNSRAGALVLEPQPLLVCVVVTEETWDDSGFRYWKNATPERPNPEPFRHRASDAAGRVVPRSAAAPRPRRFGRLALGYADSVAAPGARPGPHRPERLRGHRALRQRAFPRRGTRPHRRPPAPRVRRGLDPARVRRAVGRMAPRDRGVD